MTPEELVNLPDAEREKAVWAADDTLLRQALELAKARGAAYAAADIAYELGLRFVGKDSA